MEDIYTRDNYKKFSSKTKRKPGRPPAYVSEPAVHCFVCDEKITRQRTNLLQGPSNNKAGFPCQISELLGDEFLIIVQEDDYLCKQCVSLFNNMEKFEKQLADVKEKLLMYLTKKYNLNNNSRGPCEDVAADVEEYTENGDNDDSCYEDDDIAKQLSNLHAGNGSGSRALKCNVCDHSISDPNEFDRHVRSHIDSALETELLWNANNNNKDSCSDRVDSASSAVKLYKCRECSKVYLSKLSCVEHMRLCHLSASPPTNTNNEVFDNLIRDSKTKSETDNDYFCKSCRLPLPDNELSVVDNHTCQCLEKTSNADSVEKLQNSSKDMCGKLGQESIINKNNVDYDTRVSAEHNNETSVGSEMFSSTADTIKHGGDSVHRNHQGKQTDDSSSQNQNTQPVLNENNDDDDDDIGAGDVVYSEDDMDSDANDSDPLEEEEPEKHACGNCGLKGDLLTLKEHFLEARLQRDLICSVCGQAFNSFCKLIKHSSGHEISSKPIQCIYCPDRTTVPDLLSLNYHMKKAHLSLIDEKLCVVCDRMLPNAEYLEKHKVGQCCLDDDDVSMDISELNLNCSRTLTELSPDLEHSNADMKYSCESQFDVELKAQESLKDGNKHSIDSGCSDENQVFVNIEKHTDNDSNLSDKDSQESFSFCNDNVDGGVFNSCKSVVNPMSDSNYVEMDTTLDSVDASTGEVLNVVYKCGICGEQRDTKDELLMHFESHNSDVGDVALQSFVCDICDVVFSDGVSMSLHHKKHSRSSRNVTCLYCKSNCHDFLHLKYHIIYSHSSNITNLFCSLCNFRFTSKIAFRNHLLTVHKSSDYFCKKCNKSFNFKYKLFKHYCKYHKSELKCKYCGVKSRNLTNHIKHERFHSRNGLNLSCNICGRLFNNINSLKLHSIKHACDLNLFCANCELSFSDVNSLNDHMYSSHGGHGDLYCCDKCGKSFMYYNRYRIHRLNHENERLPYECKLCRAKFASLALRAIHKKRLHKGKYLLFKCNFCNLFATNNVYFYRRHIFLHIKKYQYHCKSCLKCYTKRGRLVEHRCRVHTRSRLYKTLKNRFSKFNINELTIISGNHNSEQKISDMSPLYCHLRNNETYVQ